MPNIKSAIKRVKVNESRRAGNISVKSDMRTAVKKVEALVVNNDVESAKSALITAAQKLDKAVGKGLVHKNTAARQKSRLAKKVNELNA
ncbi:MAG TPA: 30S ribosomal protein S20 [Bacillus bacterium]|nr:30S ribosomal protein S20 [Bacillus sp. (in: firmicutes)]